MLCELVFVLWFWQLHAIGMRTTRCRRPCSVGGSEDLDQPARAGTTTPYLQGFAR